MENTPEKPAEAKPSATIVLLRGGEADPEILMVKRRAGDVFGDSYAFPGGVVDADEFAARDFCGGATAGQADKELGVAAGGLDFYSAAVRELFEETGVLLARDAEGALAFSGNPDSASILSELREQLDAGTLGWAKMLQSNGLYVDCDALHYFAFWETPLSLSKRWAAKFFLAESPPDQDALHDGSELTDSCWMTARDVLTASKEGGMKLPFPTLTVLRDIAGYRSCAELLQWAKAQAPAGVAKIRPFILKENGKQRFVIAGDPEYPEDA